MASTGRKESVLFCSVSLLRKIRKPPLRPIPVIPTTRETEAGGQIVQNQPKELSEIPSQKFLTRSGNVARSRALACHEQGPGFKPRQHKRRETRKKPENTSKIREGQKGGNEDDFL